MGGRGPRRLSEVKAIASNYGSHLVEKKGAGHPWRFVKDGKGIYTVPAHNGLKTEIPWKYIQGLCRAHDIPETAFTK